MIPTTPTDAPRSLRREPSAPTYWSCDNCSGTGETWSVNALPSTIREYPEDGCVIVTCPECFGEGEAECLCGCGEGKVCEYREDE